MARVNLAQQPREVQDAAHAIGLDYHRPYKRWGRLFYKPYRNYFSTATGCEYFQVWESLEQQGYAESRYCGFRFGHESFVFRLTRAGLDWLGDVLGMKIYDESK